MRLFISVIAALLVGCKTSPKDQTIASPEAHTVTQDNITLTVITFDRRTTFLTVADKPEGPKSLWPNAKAAAQAHNALAVINGGFFTPEGKPLGLLIQNGTKRGSLTHTDLGTALYIDNPPSLISREEFLKTKPTAQNLLQAGPQLLWKYKIPSGLNSSNPRPRSFLLWDGQNHLALGHANSTTLSSLAHALAAQPIPGFQISHALNLDGGTSSDLWISSSVKGGDLNRRSWMSKPVRNYLILNSIQD